MSHPNEQLITRFYAAFRELEENAMAACYAHDARFRDPVFTLQGRTEIAGMWGMLCSTVRSKGRDAWRLEYSGIQADDRAGRAQWQASYRFSATGRLVHNVIEAEFEFRDGLIVRHLDRFPFWRWARQALGPIGVLLGWTPLVAAKVRAQAASNLAAYLAKSGA